MLSGEERNGLAQSIAGGMAAAMELLRRDPDTKDDAEATALALAKTAIVAIQSEGFRIVRNAPDA